MVFVLVAVLSLLVLHVSKTLYQETKTISKKYRKISQEISGKASASRQESTLWNSANSAYIYFCKNSVSKILNDIIHE